MISLAMVLFTATPINKKLKPLKQDPSPFNLCPLFSWPLHYATKENSGWKLYYSIGIDLHCARRRFPTVTWGQIHILFQIMFLWRVMLNSNWNEVLIEAQGFPVQLWSFISIQTCGRPAFPVLGFCRAELQSTYYQNAQVSSVIQFVYFFWACMSCELSWLTYCSENLFPSLTSFIHRKRNWILEFLFKE